MTRTPIRPKLKDLELGDRFYPATFEEDLVYEVTGPVVHETGKRLCRRIKTGTQHLKLIDMEVVKISQCLDCGTRVADGNKYCWFCCEDGSDF